MHDRTSGPAGWLEVAKALPAGRHTKIKCCSRDESMRVENGSKGFRAYCFRCGAAPFVRHGIFSISELRERREAEQALRRPPNIELPQDCTEDIPAHGLVWLYRSGVSNAVCKSYNVSFSPRLGRVVLPVFEKGRLTAYTARSIDGTKPKYIERSEPDAVFFSDPALEYSPEADPTNDILPHVVVSEDILSAIRIGYHVQAASMLGTSSDFGIRRKILDQAHIRGHSMDPAKVRIAVWLDGDKAGLRGSAQLVRHLKIQGYQVRTIRTPLDPKRYSNRDIRKFLTE